MYICRTKHFSHNKNYKIMIVCIAEKPSVAAEIAKVIGATIKKQGYYEGNGYQVTWTFGHLCCLKNPDEYFSDWKKWDVGILPMIPEKYDIKVIEDAGVKKQFKIVKGLFKAASTIINCGDAGQEGELIQRWVMLLAGVRCPVKRLWISSLTEESIRNGFKDLRPQSQYDPLFMAGQARANGDWLLGMNATRLYTIKFGANRQVLSIGRVQTPTLSMIVERDLQIENFKPEPYWVLTTKYRDVLFTSTQGKFSNETDGTRIINSILGKPFSIVSVQEKKGSELPQQLYDLTSLQVDCNKKFGMSAEVTLKTIQGLYEKKLTTYPRVDTKFLTDDMYAKCPSILEGLKGYESLTSCLQGKSLNKSRRVFDNSKVTDHHAIIPTVVAPSSMMDNERKVYDLICRRFISVFYPECIFATTTVIGKTSNIEFKTSGKTILSPGWKAVYNKVQSDPDEEEEKDDEIRTLPIFKQGECGPHKPSLDKKMTSPPKRFTEATLLQAMETAGKFVEDETLREAMKENGIGRPSSRAGIIETLLKRGYICRERKNLVSTNIGRDLMSVIKSRMLKSPELTGQWEKKLRDIEAGKYRLNDFMKELEQQLRVIIEEVKSDTSGVRISAPVPSTKSSSQRNSYRKK